jgi:translation initiation factor 1
MSKERIPTDGGSGLRADPFASLSAEGLASVPEQPATMTLKSVCPPRNRGRVEIRRTTAGRGGKTVTLISGFVGIGLPEKEALAKAIQKAAGAGGTVKDGSIEIQGDKREVASQVLAAAGFRPVMAGG